MIRKKAKNTLVSAFGSGHVSRDGTNFAVSCPECDQNKVKKKLSVRLDDFRYHCWVCGLKGKNVWNYISRKYPGVHIDPCLFKKKVQKERVEEKTVLSLPEGLIPVFRASSDPDIKSVKNYMKRRGYSSDSIERWRIMSAKSGKFRRRVFIPSFDSSGVLNYFVGRSIDESSIKYINAKVPKSEIIFNEIDIEWKKEVVLVEGVFDAMKSPENTVPLLGSTLSRTSRLYRALMKNESSVVVSLDPDLKEKAFKIAKDLYSAGCKVRICFAPEGKDMGDMTASQNLEMIENARPFNPYISLSHRINSIRSGSII